MKVKHLIDRLTELDEELELEFYGEDRDMGATIPTISHTPSVEILPNGAATIRWVNFEYK